MGRINPHLGLNYIHLLAISASTREKLEQYVLMETYAMRVEKRMNTGVQEQDAHIAELEEYVNAIGEKRIGT